MILLSGCAGPFSQFYQDQTGGVDITTSTRFVISSDEPRLFRGDDPEKDIQRMLEEGYWMVGYSSFYYPGDVDASKAIIQAKRVHASVVLFSSKYKDTVSGVAPKTVPKTEISTTSLQGSAQSYGNSSGCIGIYGCGSVSGTTNTDINGMATTTTRSQETVYVPYKADRYDYLATYWVKIKPRILGVITLDLSPEIRQKIGSNKGVIVSVIIKGSPAFVSDILKDDILKRIGEKEILDTKSFQDILEQYAGKKVEIFLIREGKEIRKELQLNERTE